MIFRSFWGITRLVCNIKNNKLVAAVFFALVIIFFCNTSFAAGNLNRYEVVNGSDDKAYLVDTTTGFVWVLTYRTMATGREPVAIPYKFIKISPNNTKTFLVEDAKEGALLPIK